MRAGGEEMEFAGARDPCRLEAVRQRRMPLGAGGPETVTAPPKRKTAAKAKTEVAQPQMYRVLMLNDDYTPMEFVVQVLKEYFGMPEPTAVAIMLAVHRQGKAVVGVFTFDIAETKVATVMAVARRHEHPLRCMLEPE